VWDRTYGSLLQFRRRYNHSYLDSMLWGRSGADVGPPLSCTESCSIN
jgi:hypothetical protein